jgi:hypothetical protein
MIDTTFQLLLFIVASFATWKAGVAFGRTLITPTMSVAEAREIVVAADLACEAARLKYATTANVLAFPQQVQP